LLDDPQKRESMAKSAFASFNEKLTTQAATEHLEPILNEAMSKG
jgi:hypothetical protein